MKSVFFCDPNLVILFYDLGVDCVVMLIDLIFDLRRHDKYIKHMPWGLAYLELISAY